MEADPRAVVIAALVAGLLAGYGIAMPVGAVGAYLVALTARTSLRTGACAALGVATADGVYASLATFGGSALAPALRPVMLPLRWISAVALLVLAISGTAKAIRQHRERQHRERQAAASSEEAPLSPVRAYLVLWGMTMMNPITLVYFAALVLGRRTAAAAGYAEQAVFVLAAFVASASWQLVMAGTPSSRSSPEELPPARSDPAGNRPIR
jgi:threonine/homoserine/homoserine lactone efflux protein